jgi:hypothetical protein
MYVHIIVRAAKLSYDPAYAFYQGWRARRVAEFNGYFLDRQGRSICEIGEYLSGNVRAEHSGIFDRQFAYASSTFFAPFKRCIE